MAWILLDESTFMHYKYCSTFFSNFNIEGLRLLWNIIGQFHPPFLFFFFVCIRLVLAVKYSKSKIMSRLALCFSGWPPVYNQGRSHLTTKNLVWMTVSSKVSHIHDFIFFSSCTSLLHVFSWVACQRLVQDIQSLATADRFSSAENDSEGFYFREKDRFVEMPDHVNKWQAFLRWKSSLEIYAANASHVSFWPLNSHMTCFKS